MEIKHQYIQIFRHNGEELGHYIDQDGCKLRSFGSVSHVNILVGATNSGKSRFMRGLAKNSPYKSITLDLGLPTPQYILNLCQKLKDENFSVRIVVNPHGNAIANDPKILGQIKSAWLAQQLKRSKNGQKPREHNWDARIFSTILGFLEPLFGDLETNDSQQLHGVKANIEWVQFGIKEPDELDKEWCLIERNNLTQAIVDDIKEVIDFCEILSDEILNRYYPKQVIYVPVLRTAMILKEISPTKSGNETDRLTSAIISNYDFNIEQNKNRDNKKKPLNNDVEVFTGNSLYWIVQREKSGEPDVKRRLKRFEEFLQENFFEGHQVELSPLNNEHSKGQRLALFIDDKEDIPVKDLGDGIQAIIVMMYRVFTAEDGAWIFIEEPEQGLHPGLQRIFLNCLSNNEYLKSKNLTVFMTTHSNHLLGVALSELEDVSVFTFQERGFPGPFEVRPIFTPNTKLLDMLGTSNTSVFLANCGIWVEGVTDRRYLRAYLAAYMNSDEFTSKFRPREDIHYAFFEYAGSNLAHYLFEADDEKTDEIKARFLCNRIFLLADQDKGKEAKHDCLRAMQDDNFCYEVTIGKEVENLISGEQLKLSLPRLIQGIAEVETVKFNIDDYRNEGMGTYLQKTLGKECPKALSAPSGTLSAYYKGHLSTIVAEITTWENMSEDAKDLTRKLYQFIDKHNNRRKG